jgi:ketosteroid isomerase-like protein
LTSIIRRNVFLALVAVALLLGWSSLGANTPKPILSSSDRDAIRAVHERYRRAWLANDAQAVRNTFTEDAVLLPHHGVPPVVGIEAINQFWWPADGLPTTIDILDLTYDDIGGDGVIGYVRGRSKVEWTVQEHGTAERFRNEGNYLSLLRKMPDGSWKITHHMWNDPPNQRQ